MLICIIRDCSWSRVVSLGPSLFFEPIPDTTVHRSQSERGKQKVRQKQNHVIRKYNVTDQVEKYNLTYEPSIIKEQQQIFKY